MAAFSPDVTTDLVSSAHDLKIHCNFLFCSVLSCFVFVFASPWCNNGAAMVILCLFVARNLLSKHSQWISLPYFFVTCCELTPFLSSALGIPVCLRRIYFS